MSLQLQLLLLTAVVAAMATAATSADHPMYVGTGSYGGMGQSLVADSMSHLDSEMMMESDISRRQLTNAGYISYAALARNRVPCDQRGQSYYNCRGHQKANPYNRGCTRVTACARSTR